MSSFSALERVEKMVIAGEEFGQLANFSACQPVRGGHFGRIGLQWGGRVEIDQPPAQVDLPRCDTLPEASDGNHVHAQLLAQLAPDRVLLRFAGFDAPPGKQ